MHLTKQFITELLRSEYNNPILEVSFHKEDYPYHEEGYVWWNRIFNGHELSMDLVVTDNAVGVYTLNVVVDPDCLAVY